MTLIRSEVGRGCAVWKRRRATIGARSQPRRGRGSGRDSAVVPAARLPCAARSCGPPQNSLRSLRSLRSDSCGESVVDARFARCPQALRCSAPHTPAAPPAPRLRAGSTEPRRPLDTQLGSRSAGASPGCGLLARAEQRRACSPRAQRASTTDLPQLLERSERSERSEFCGGLQDRAAQGTCRAAAGACVCPRPGHARRCARVIDGLLMNCLVIRNSPETSPALDQRASSPTPPAAPPAAREFARCALPRVAP